MEHNQDTKEVALYMLDTARRAIENEDWLSVRRPLQYVALLCSFQAIAEERRGPKYFIPYDPQ